MTTVSAAEVAKNFGDFRERAQTEPVLVTQYGKPSVVILSAAEYERLRDLDRRIMTLDSLSDDDLADMVAAEIPADHRYALGDISE